MARRKVVAVGRASSNWLEQALGFWPRRYVRDLLEDVERPRFDYAAVEARTGLILKEEWQNDISDAYEGYSLSVLTLAVADATDRGEDFGAQTSGEMDQAEFKKLVFKLQKAAKGLRALTDRLAELDAGLLLRPYDNRDRSYSRPRPRHDIEEALSCSDASYTASLEDFSDYYSFRKILDYLENFEKTNERFNNLYDLRYSFETDYSGFEFLVRQIVVALRFGGYPSTITIPTDSNPHYESPIIAALLEFQKQHNDAYNGTILSDGPVEQNYSYRQFAHLVGLIVGQLDDLEEVCATLRRGPN